MSVLPEIAYYRNRRDEVPNQELARKLVETGNVEGIGEIAENLENENSSVQSDCLKVLYEIGYLAPELIADYVGQFLALLRSKNNRMVWGSMIALATIADLRSAEIWNDVDFVIECVNYGSVITEDWGIRVLARLAASDDAYDQRLFPLLLNYLRDCLPREVPRRAESILPAVDADHKEQFRAVLEWRKPDLTASQLVRLNKTVRQVEAL
jgi:hypothetical protein